MRAIVFVYADEAPSRSFCIRFSPCSSAQQQRRMRWKMAQNHTFFLFAFVIATLCLCWCFFKSRAAFCTHMHPAVVHTQREETAASERICRLISLGPRAHVSVQQNTMVVAAMNVSAGALCAHLNEALFV
jgi:hypothetical protein